MLLLSATPLPNKRQHAYHVMRLCLKRDLFPGGHLTAAACVGTHGQQVGLYIHRCSEGLISTRLRPYAASFLLGLRLFKIKYLHLVTICRACAGCMSLTTLVQLVRITFRYPVVSAIFGSFEAVEWVTHTVSMHFNGQLLRRTPIKYKQTYQTHNDRSSRFDNTSHVFYFLNTYV